MELRWLSTFIAVVDNRGFANAAEALYCSQPTVSGQISALEAELGTELFDRDRRPVRLTQPGEALLSHARAVINEVEAARGTVSDVLGVRRGEVRLGTYPSATAGYVPRLLGDFQARYPGVRVRLIEVGGADLEEAATSGDIDLFVRQTTPPVSSAVFTSRPLWTERFKMVIHPDDEYAKQSGPIDAQVLLQHPLIMTGRYQPESLSTHPLWYALGEPPVVAYQVSQPQSLIELVRAGLGFGVTTQLALDVSRAEGLVIRDIDHPDAIREVAVFWPRARRLSAAGEALRDFMLDGADVPAGTQDDRVAVSH